MSKKDSKLVIEEIRERLATLSSKPDHFDQLIMAERVELARHLCNDASELARASESGRIEQELWKQAAELFHQTIDEAYPRDFEENLEQLEKGDPAGLKMAITFLELDPWFFRSGYVKADLIRLICRMSIPPTEAVRLQKVILAAIDLRDRREFRWYCKLAKAVKDKSFKLQVTERIGNQDSGVRRRARWVLSAITHNKTFHIQRGIKDYGRGRYREAIGDFTRALFLDPASATAFLERGKAYIELGKLEDGLSDFSRVIELSRSKYRERFSLKGSHGRHLAWMPIFGVEVEAYEWRGWTYAELRKYELAAADYSQAIAHGQPDAFTYCKRGRALYNLGKYEQALIDLNRSIILDSEYEEAYFMRGLCYLDQEHFELAVNEFLQSLEFQPLSFWTSIHLSEAYFSLGKYDEALEAAQRALTVDMGSPTAYLFRGMASARLKKFDEAISDFSRAIELCRCRENASYEGLDDRSTTEVDAYEWRGWTYAQLGKYDLAAADYSYLIELKPGDAFYHCKRGRALNNVGDLEHAIEDLNRSILLDPERKEAYFLRGLVYFKQRFFERAVEEFLQALRFDHLAYWPNLNLSEAYLFLGKYQEAFEAAQTAVDIDSKSAPAYFCRGRARFGMGENDEALKDLTQSIELNPKLRNGEHFFYRSMVYHRLGLKKEQAENVELAEKEGFIRLMSDDKAEENTET